MKTARQYRSDLDLLTKQVTLYLAKLDHLMSQPSSDQRGRDIAKLSNELQLANDIAIRFGLEKK